MGLKLRAQVLPKQAEYILSTSPTAMYAGGVGAGKTIANVVLAIHLATKYPGIEILCCAPTYGMLWDITIREFNLRCPPILLSDFRKSPYPEAVFHPNKGRVSTVRFRAFDDAGKPKGITVGAALIEEVTEMERDILDEIANRLRQDGMPNYLRMATNTDSTDHYIYQDYVKPVEEGVVSKAEIHYVHTTSFENYLLPEAYRERLKRWEKTRPGFYMRKVLGLWGDFEDGTIGLPDLIDDWTTPYRVAFIDTSFSDRAKSDRTAVSIVAYSPTPDRQSEHWPIEFTGKSWQESISNSKVIDELLFFLDQHRPIESCLESQLGDSTAVFIDKLKASETRLKLPIKNYWTWHHQSRNKHERIMFEVAANKDRLRAIRGTDQHYLNRIAAYKKGVEHEDEIDSLAGGIARWKESKALQAYIRRAMSGGR